MPIASGRIALKAALGMLRPGYLLGVTRQHVTSFAQLSKAALTEVDRAFNAVEQQLSSNLHAESYLRLEHGSDNVDSCGLGAGACVVRAHQHLIPITQATGEHMLRQDVSWHRLDSYASLADLRGSSYLYIGFSGKHYAAVDPKVRSQWGRRIIAAVDRHQDWDWAVFSGAMNLLQTLIAQGTVPQGRTIFSQDGPAIFEPRTNRRGEQYK